MVIKIGYAAGAFDLFHVGHLNILKHAKSQCDYLIAGVVSDEMLIQNKGITPVIPLAERLEIVSHISYVDQARAEVVPDKLDTWREVGFDVFFKGDDWRDSDLGELCFEASESMSSTSRTQPTRRAASFGASSTSCSNPSMHARRTEARLAADKSCTPNGPAGLPEQPGLHCARTPVMT